MIGFLFSIWRLRDDFQNIGRCHVGMWSGSIHSVPTDPNGLDSSIVMQELDKLWPEIFPEEELGLLQKASLRAAFKMCQEITQPSVAMSAPASAPSASDALSSAGTWAESFPPKLDAALIEQMKSKFLTSYPSELVNHDTMPSYQTPQSHTPSACEETMGMGSMEVSPHIGESRGSDGTTSIQNAKIGSCYFAPPFSGRAPLH